MKIVDTSGIHQRIVEVEGEHADREFMQNLEFIIALFERKSNCVNGPLDFSCSIHNEMLTIYALISQEHQVWDFEILQPLAQIQFYYWHSFNL